MNTLLTTQFTAANICHEIANYMSVIKFQQEDILEKIENGITFMDSAEQLFNNIDNTILMMDFFRNLYSPSDSRNEVSKLALKICKQKGVKVLNFTPEFEESFTSTKVEKTVAGILFLITRVNNGKFNVVFSIVDKAIVMDIKGCVGAVQRRFIKMLNTDINDEDKEAFNIIAYYVKKLLAYDKLTIKTDDKIVDTLRIKICK